MRALSLGARAFVPAALAAAILIPLGAPSPVAADGPAGSRADAAIRAARAELGARYVWGAIGPDSFDCSGLVLHSFRRSGNYGAVANGRFRTSEGMYAWYRSRGLASRTRGAPGDLVVYGGGSHIGIYLGGGKAISALTRGVTVHGVYAVSSGFTAFLHTGLSGTPRASRSAPAPTRATTTFVNLRTGAGVSNDRIAVLRPSRRLAVLSTARDGGGRLWYRVRVSGANTTGYVAGWLTR